MCIIEFSSIDFGSAPYQVASVPDKMPGHIKFLLET